MEFICTFEAYLVVILGRSFYYPIRSSKLICYTAGKFSVDTSNHFQLGMKTILKYFHHPHLKQYSYKLYWSISLCALNNQTPFLITIKMCFLIHSPHSPYNNHKWYKA